MTDSLLSDLQTPFMPEEVRAIEGLLGLIEEARKKVESSDFSDWKERLEKLAHLRIRSSNTLKRGDMNSWVQANVLIEDLVRLRKVPTWPLICQVNSLLSGKPSEQVVRNEPIYIGPFQASPPDKLQQHIHFFTENILPSEKTERHPLILAALIQYWIVSLHPFWDANGRTAVLIADWINLSSGYFPQVFEVQIDAVIGHFSSRASKATPARAVYKVLKNTLQSYQTFLS